MENLDLYSILDLTLLLDCDTLFVEEELLTGIPVVIDKLALSRADSFEVVVLT